MKTRALTLLLVLTLTACADSSSDSTKNGSGGGSGGTSEDVSASGTAASVVGGVILLTGTTPSMASDEVRPRRNLFLEMIVESTAQASGACPTFLSASGSGCSNTTSQVVTVTYSNCTFSGSSATFNGTDLVETDDTSLSCGTYPTISDGNYLGHQYSGTRTASSGTVVTESASGTNYTGTSTGSTGVVALFTGGVRTQIVVYGGRYVSTGKFDMTVGQYASTALTVATSGSTRTVNGGLTVYNNTEKVKGTSTFSNVIYSAGCCQPTGGKITTSFVAGTNGNSSSSYVGKTETLAFSSTCGSATLTAVDGSSSTVSLVHCL